jgi:hypothetical protein
MIYLGIGNIIAKSFRYIEIFFLLFMPMALALYLSAGNSYRGSEE